jgi:hypothetical protein
MNDIKKKAQELASYGRNGDTVLAHINPEEAALLKSLGGSGTINPDTGLPEYFWSALIGAGASLLGGSMASRSANRAADAQLQASREAAEAARFRPYAVTTGFGRSFFDEGAQTAGYEIDPRLAAFRDRNYGLATNVYDQLGAADPQAFAAQVMAERQGLLQPTRMAEDIALRNQQLGRGRIGLGLTGAAAGAGMGGMINPEQFSLQRARALADAQMSAEAREQGQADIERLISRAGGLFQTGAGIEELGLKPLTLGADLGKTGVAAGSGMAQALLAGGTGAANANLAAGLNRANMFQQLGNTISGMNFGGMFGGGMPTGSTGGISPMGGNASRGFTYGGW